MSLVASSNMYWQVNVEVDTKYWQKDVYLYFNARL